MSHDPTRPEWSCDTCPPGTPWPCSPARVRLGERYRGDLMGLSVYMAGQLGIAAQESSAADPVELHERFMAWTRPRPPR